MNDSLEDYYKEVEREVLEEIKASDPVYQKIKVRYFTSKSKGIRNGKQRKRKKWKEITLVKYTDGFHQLHRFPLDVYATEILGEWAVGEILKERILDMI